VTGTNQQLQGTTLNVYLYAVDKGKPVGPRDVMKATNLSSPSVAYRHLQKLEDLGFLQKNVYGEYTVVKKAKIKGHVWVGQHLLSKMRIYAAVFLVILVIEVSTLIIHFEVETNEFKVFFLLLTLVTGLALAVFSIEDFLQWKRRRNHVADSSG
jgi:hypothetical protein